MHCHHFYSLTLVLGLALAQRAQSAEIDFARDIRPVLSENCFFCHGPDPQHREADLRLDTASGAATVTQLDELGQSELVRRVLSQDVDEQMPPPDSNRRLSPAQIELLTAWVSSGAEWETHWSFTPIVAPSVPQIDSQPAHPIRNPIDAFVQDKLVEIGLSPNPDANRQTLIRRLSLDLTGLPPTPQQVAEFTASDDPLAYEHLVDRLLDSPRFGERMAWDWLDAARYADTNGYQGDNERTMWPWRDWIVRAFNENMPFDQFTVWQVAGDLLPDASDEQKLATGFLRNHMINGEGGRIAEENRIEYLFDMAETTGTVWLGLTMNCCRCHDHKYDPLTNQDYYQLLAFFDQTPVTGRGGDPQTAPVIRWPKPEQSAQLAELAQAIADQKTILQKIDASISQRPPRPSTALTSQSPPAFIAQLPQYQQSQKKLEELTDQRERLEKQVPKVMVMQDMAEPRQSFMLERGLYNKPTQPVTAATPGFLSAAATASKSRLANPAQPDSADQRLNRLHLADWIIADDNPLTARVIANRFWQQFFGVGLVKTSEDFGAQGEIPRQLDLLNWLAADFRDNGWNVKRLVRTMVTSHTYRQSSRHSAQLNELDPENRWLARGARFRLPSWMLRDQALAASGLLSPIAEGPAVNTYQPSGVWEEATFGNKTYQPGQGEELYRRSLFIFWRRIIAPTMFFDNASRQTCTVKSVRTNTPLQALLTLNETTYVEAARTLAQLALKSACTTDPERLDLVMQRVLARDATAAERNILLAGMQRTRDYFTATPEDASQLVATGQSPRDESLAVVDHAQWTILCLNILNLDETLNRE